MINLTIFFILYVCIYIRNYCCFINILLKFSFMICLHIYIYIYIYIYISLRKNKTGHIRIINLFQSCYVFLIKSKNTKKKINRTSSDLMSKINQNRHRKEEWEGDRRYIYICYSKNFKLHPDFWFVMHLSPLYGPHLLWN